MVLWQQDGFEYGQISIYDVATLSQGSWFRFGFICRHYYYVGVVEHSWCIHTNISMRFHLLELRQSWSQYGENIVFWINLWEIVWMEVDENLGIQTLLPSWQYQLLIFTKALFIIRQYLQAPPTQPWLRYPSARSVGFEMLIEQSSCQSDQRKTCPFLNMARIHQSSIIIIFF